LYVKILRVPHIRSRRLLTSLVHDTHARDTTAIYFLDAATTESRAEDDRR
jgi:hypothetical protein